MSYEKVWAAIENNKPAFDQIVRWSCKPNLREDVGQELYVVACEMFDAIPEDDRTEMTTEELAVKLCEKGKLYDRLRQRAWDMCQLISRPSSRNAGPGTRGYSKFTLAQWEAAGKVKQLKE